jgi:PKHD-type hydroxylase
MNIYNTPYWWWNGILSPELCDVIIGEGDKLISDDGRVGGNGAGVYDPRSRETNISFFDQHHWISGLCLHYAMAANANAQWNIDINGSQNVQYARYFPDQHYNLHRDASITQELTMRKLSVAIQISDPSTYEGGEFEIEGTVLEDFKARGSVVVFPSILMHGIKPVTKGVRHSIVCWITGPRFR